MTLKPSQLVSLLHSKRDDFAHFNHQAITDLQRYRTSLKQVAKLSAAEVDEKLRQCEAPGAIPLEPTHARTGWILNAQLNFTSREQSFDWARQRIVGVSTFAVDGSQVFPSKDLSLPIALVQVGWFENPHTLDGKYTKDVELDVMTPAELRTSNSGEPADRRVNMRRFQMETERLITYMRSRQSCENCLVFLDGSLIATFAEALDAEGQKFYVDCLLSLLRTSEQTRVPLVAYIDTSYSRDLTTLLQVLFDLPPTRSVHDAQLLNPILQRWGDRSGCFRSVRGGDTGILSDYQEHENRIAFAYLKAHEGYPVRLEFPVWLVESGLLDRVLDWVRCEVIIGGGYPYVIETADQTAVLQAEDRYTFYRILQDWAEQEELSLRFSRKMVSKVRRRR
ncbi:DNA double-strand break repair nuclease NurA [Leptolyngbya sp. FACHB-261]|uniref:DNA double-strand break repair nuclease NurA n=1 Tax=Leptolyngbya sp. FACHB-261 TaxID=2692806 RepID=UPI0016823093|nr:DNA double-strand break repair nuclease NurA [Leptolyngbya sp. FACHB-261]MBD2102878.1 DNA double-strand break repair nuclease NurA [Leptolyngbya sp. FACHB-261]